MFTERTKFLLRNLLKGFIWLAVIIIIFIAFKKLGKAFVFHWLDPILNQPLLVYLIFLASEIVFGIIPPEIFMLWGLRTGDAFSYAFVVGSLALLSYGSGIVGFFIGRYFQNTRIYRLLRYKRIIKYEDKLREYGLYLIIVASLTPVPFSAMSMLVGAVRYPIKDYLLFSLARFIRFSTYSWIIWQANML